MQIRIVRQVVQSLLRAVASQVERGTEAVTLISCVLEACDPLQPGRLHVLGRSITAILGAVDTGPAVTPTTVANVLSCLQIPAFAAYLLANPEECSGLGGEAAVDEGSESYESHIAELLGLAAALFSTAGGHTAGAEVLDAVLNSEDTDQGALHIPGPPA